MLFLSRCHSCYQTGWRGGEGWGGREAKQKDFIYPKPIYCEVLSQKLSFFQAQTQATGLLPGKCCSKGLEDRLFVMFCDGGAAVFFLWYKKVSLVEFNILF